MEVKLYTTHCPMCKGVEAMLKNKNIAYDEIEGEDPIREMGFRSAPVLVVDGTPYVGKAIYDWFKTVGKNN